jgi:hypothetical protein
MDDEITVRRIQPYPRKNDENNKSQRKNESEIEDEDKDPDGEKRPSQPEIKEGHIDTRVSPRWQSI